MSEKNDEIKLEEGTAEQNKSTIEMKGSPESISTIQPSQDEINASVLAAARSTNKAPKRLADKENANDKDDLKKEDVSLSDAFKSLIQEAGLDETLVVKATGLFEAAFAEKVKSFETELVEDFTAYKAEIEKQLKEEFENSLNKLEEQVKTYSDHVAERYLEENKLSIENGIRLELAESLMTGLQKVFVEHNIAIPEKIDALKTLEEKVNEVTKQLNEEINKNISLKKELELHEAAKIIDKICEGLTATQIEKVRNLAESLTYSNLEELKVKVETIAETVTSTSKSTVKTPSTDFLNESSPENPVKDSSIYKDIHNLSKLIR